MLNFLNSRRLGIFRVAFAVAEGVAFAVATRRPVMPLIALCLIFTAMRLRLEDRLP